jgi:DNA-binding transcriptional LysR family regulator
MIRELRTLLAVARHGSFAKAAKYIGLTQAAVSAQMQRLEEDLGSTLFDRTARSATLNELGQRTVERAEEIIKLYGNLSSHGELPYAVGKVTVGAIESAQAGALVDALVLFHARMQDCRVRILPARSLSLLGTVDSGEVDLGVMVRPPYALPQELHWRTVATQPFRLVVHRSVRGRDWRAVLESEPFVRYERTSFGGRQAEQFLQRHKVAVNDAVELNDLHGMLRLVASRIGVALMPVSSSMQASWPPSVRAIDLGAETFHREVGVVYREDRLQRVQVREFVDCVSTAFAREAGGVVQALR